MCPGLETQTGPRGGGPVCLRLERGKSLFSGHQLTLALALAMLGMETHAKQAFDHFIAGAILLHPTDRGNLSFVEGVRVFTLRSLNIVGEYGRGANFMSHSLAPTCPLNRSTQLWSPNRKVPSQLSPDNNTLPRVLVPQGSVKSDTNHSPIGSSLSISRATSAWIAQLILCAHNRLCNSGRSRNHSSREILKPWRAQVKPPSVKPAEQ